MSMSIFALADNSKNIPMKIQKFLQILISTSCLLILASCGGGSSDSNESGNSSGSNGGNGGGNTSSNGTAIWDVSKFDDGSTFGN